MNNRQSFDTEYVINAVANSMKGIRSRDNALTIFISFLSLLYAFRKGYSLDLQNLSKANAEDNLLRDLLNNASREPVVQGKVAALSLEMANWDRDSFNNKFGEILTGLFDIVSRESGNSNFEFYTPQTITKLISYFIEEEKCQSVYDPFCGSAAICKELTDRGTNVLFKGQEISQSASLLARVLAEYVYGDDSCISTCDSSSNWDKGMYDAVASCPPIGVNSLRNDMEEGEHPRYPHRTLEEMACIRPFMENGAKITVTLLRVGFCGMSWASDMRDYLVNHNMLDTVVYLPKGILYGTSMETVLLVCKKDRSDNSPIRFIHAGHYITGDRRNQNFDYERFEKMMRTDAKDCASFSLEDIKRNSNSLLQGFYVNQQVELKKGQRFVKLGDMISPVKGMPLGEDEEIECIPPTSFRSYFIDVLLNKDEATKSFDKTMKRKVEHIQGASYLLAITSSVLGNRYCLYNGAGEFCFDSHAKAFRINTDIVTPEYLVLTLLNDESLRKLSDLQNALNLPIAIEGLEKQKEIVEKEKQQYINDAEREKEADQKRLNVVKNISDLEHMLGFTYNRINDLITVIETKLPDDKYVKSLKDNYNYLTRVIHYNNASIKSGDFWKSEGNIKKFLTDYSESWKNYGESYFELQLDDALEEDVVVSFDEAMLTVMLDSVLSNVGRHGFKKIKRDTNIAQLRLSLVKCKGRSCVLISIANNGEPIKEGFTITDYISKGRYTGENGRSGLGGNHVYQIVKGHDGYMYLDKNKSWNVIVDMLIPVKFCSNQNISDYEHEQECI